MDLLQEAGTSVVMPVLLISVLRLIPIKFPWELWHFFITGVCVSLKGGGVLRKFHFGEDQIECWRAKGVFISVCFFFLFLFLLLDDFLSLK